MKTILTLCLVLCVFTARAGENFVRITLPKSVSVQLPRNWTALTKNQKITLDATVQSVNERIGIFDATSDLNFAANYFEDDNKTAAIFNIRYYPETELTQRDAADAPPSDIKELDALTRTGIDQSLKGYGGSILEWRGTKRQTINGAVVFISEYTRSAVQNNGEFCSRLVRVLRGRESYTVTVSYRRSQELLLRPICDKVINSIKNE